MSTTYIPEALRLKANHYDSPFYLPAPLNFARTDAPLADSWAADVADAPAAHHRRIERIADLYHRAAGASRAD